MDGPRTSRFVAIDGVLVDPERAVVSVYDRGFLYGDSIFETIRTYAGEPFELEAHLERLAWSAERVGLTLPLGPAALAEETRRLLAEIRARGASGEHTIRIMVTRGEGPMGLDPTPAVSARRVVFLEPMKGPPPEAYLDGVSVITVTTYRPSDAARGAKVGNYLESILAIREARAAGAHEALIVDTRGVVLEGTTSNVLAIKGGLLLTPPATLTILPGITRKLVLAAAPDAGLVAREVVLTTADLLAADELLLTSTIREVLPVVRVDGTPIGSGKPGPKTRTLHAAFRARAGLEPPHSP
ncbi:MAG: aminotransferase class IV [Myxococcales bacterium]|nr:aminotransferase class IV [Myxococcales bacterium]